ncbi:hypothetical protein [Mycobacteroides abscessus]|uniref:hypothetical protein n=1 Tax=Mycobacteroides abscessus TaxID=36809 RepID=UPI0021076599|nr:hypothetical protein [Mycobacteroides abscessus]
MAVEGKLFLGDEANEGKHIKWLLWGDTQTRLDLAWSEFVLLEEIREAPAFRRALQIIEENGMTGFGPFEYTNPRLLGEKARHICFLHPRLQGLEASEMPRMMEILPMS